MAKIKTNIMSAGNFLRSIGENTNGGLGSVLKRLQELELDVVHQKPHGKTIALYVDKDAAEKTRERYIKEKEEQTTNNINPKYEHIYKEAPPLHIAKIQSSIDRLHERLTTLFRDLNVSERCQFCDAEFQANKHNDYCLCDDCLRRSK